MRKEFMIINIKGKRVCVNELDPNGWEIVDGETYETFVNDDFCFFFSIEEFYEDQVGNNGDGDFYYKTKEVELDELAFYTLIDEEAHQENRHVLDLDTSIAITKICNQKYYNVETIW